MVSCCYGSICFHILILAPICCQLGSIWGAFRGHSCTKMDLNTTWGPKWSQKAPRSEECEIPGDVGHRIVPPIFMFVCTGVENLRCFCMFFSGTVSLPFSMDSWTPGRSTIMQKHSRVSQNQGFANLGKVCFQTPFGSHFLFSFGDPFDTPKSDLLCLFVIVCEFHKY